MTGRIGVWALAVLVTLPTAAAAQLARPRVESVITAINDVYDVASIGDTLLFATSGGLVIRRADGSTTTVTSRQGLPGTRLRSVSVLADGAVWVSSIEGVAQLRFDPDGRVEVRRTLPLRRVRRAVRYDGSTWFASYGPGLFRLDDGEGSRPRPVAFGSHPTHDHQTDLAVSGRDIWVSTAGAGIFRLGPDGRIRSRLRVVHGLADDLVWRLVATGDRLLVATANGVSVIRNFRVDPVAPESQAAARLPVRDVRALLPMGNELWLASHGGGVFRLTAGHEQPERLGAGAAEHGILLPRALAPASDGVMVGHARGVYQIRTDGSVVDRSGGGLPSGDVTALERAFGVLWIGTYSHGLARIEAGGVVAVDQALSRWGLDRRVNDLAVTEGGTPSERLWIATDRGLYWHDGRRFVQVQDPSAPSAQEHVTSLHVHPSTGDLWTASSRQLSRWDRRHWSSWTGGPSLPIANLHAVTSDRRGDIWVGGLHGLFRFDPGEGSFERHSVSTGDLPVDWVTALAPWGEGIVAGTYHGGLSWFDGEAFRVETEAPEGGLPSGWVNPHALSWAGETLWIGTLEGGLVFGREGRWDRLDLNDGLPSRDVTAVLSDGQDAVWVGTRGGLARVVWE